MAIIKKFNVNVKGRDFVIGDLHGCYDVLMAEMKKVSFDKSVDRLFAVGDLVDRGPDSLKCLELVFEPWFFSVLGNHEELMFCGQLDQSPPEYQCWVQNGGLWHLNHTDEPDFEDTLLASRSLFTLAIEIDTKSGRKVGIVHGEAPSVWEPCLIRDNRMSVLWGRDRINKGKDSIVPNIDMVYVGHTPLKEPCTLGNVRYIDTGVNWSGELTMEEIK